MRATAKENGVTVKAYAGTTGILLGMNIDEVKRSGLLGFAIKRVRVSQNKSDWLEGALHFPNDRRKPGKPVSTRKAPIQKFRWSDYSVYPDEEYKYTIHPVYGTPEKAQVDDGPTVTVRTESINSGEHRVIFNRAAAASQAFSRRFKGFLDEYAAARKAKRPVPSLPPAALEWLTRGLLDQILNFIRRATDSSWGLDIAIYEYELPAIIQEVVAAHDRGAKVRVVFHAKPRDEQTEENIHNLAGLPVEFIHGRVTSKIFHHKFIVLSKIEAGKYQPQAVLCGSTNFTENGLYRQANVAHIAEQAETARQYLNLFEVLFGKADVKATRKYINDSNTFGEPQAVFAGFSPRSKLADLNRFIEIVNSAKQDVLFCTAFNLYSPLQDALLGTPHDPILRYGLQNKPSKITGFHSDRTANFAAAALLPSGLEGWIKETMAGQKGNILVHTKIAIVDFTSDSPTIISGSHNLSKPASDGNDENYLILRDNPNVSDTYGCELMRIYEHYRFRYKLVSERKRKAKVKAGADVEQEKSLTLCPDDSWTNEYFGGDALKTLDRKRFAGEPA